MSRTRAYEKPNGQTIITIPDGLADAVDAAGDRWEWELTSRDRIVLKRVNDDD